MRCCQWLALYATPSCTAYSLPGAGARTAAALSWQPRARALRLNADSLPAVTDTAAPLERSDTAAALEEKSGAALEEKKALTGEDLDNTKWQLLTTPRPDGWLGGGVRQQEFTLLADSSVVWGGAAGGFGTGGRWTLRDGILEVIRTTPLGLVTGRDYYMATAEISGVDEQLKLQMEGIIRSYNALYPVGVVADFVATRVPGRFVMDDD